MAYREFTDSSGAAWTVFDVKPRVEDRRAYDRRRDAFEAQIDDPADKRAADRRVTVGADHPVRLTTGWLCFEGQGERRRLQPIPEPWPNVDDRDLDLWLKKARVAPNRQRAGAKRAG